MRVIRFDQPVIAVGNVTVGGTGKTPFTIWLVSYLRERGFHPGVVSRGHGRRDISETSLVRSDSDPYEVGDEPLMIAIRTSAPVAVSKNRSDAIRLLLDQANCDIFVCDDALQHYSLATDVSIALIDAGTRFGNGFCLPAGPLRERSARLDSADLQLIKGAGPETEFSMRYEFKQVVNVRDDDNRRAIDFLKQGKVIAIAGIANPDGFFDMLRQLDIDFDALSFPDHHPFTEQDFRTIEEEAVPLVMTEKDAVKCRGFARGNWWYLPIETIISKPFVAKLTDAMSMLQPSGSWPAEQ